MLQWPRNRREFWILVRRLVVLAILAAVFVTCTLYFHMFRVMPP
jgi:hypothetical protein